MPDQTLPYGLRDVKLYALTGETPGTAVDLPDSQTFSFAEAEAFDTLRGDDSIVAIHGKGPEVNWEIAQGGISLQAAQTIIGGTLVVTGTGATLVTTLTKRNTDVRPYFQAQGQAISDSGGDFHAKLYRCRCTSDFKGDMKDGAFWVSDFKGQAIGRASDGVIYDLIENATITALV